MDITTMTPLQKISRRLFPVVILAAIGGIMLAISWRKWPDILVDFGRELYVPWRLSEGDVLYRDIAVFNGPLSQYFNALLFKIFGANLMTLIFFNIFIIAMLSYLIYRIFYEMTDNVTALTATAAFLTIFAFSQYIWCGNYNFVCPYSHEITHGIFLSFLAIRIFYYFAKKKKIIYAGYAGFLAGVIFLTKVEIFLAIFSAICAGLCLFAVFYRPDVKRVLTTIAMFLTSMVIPIAGFAFYLFLKMSFTEALSCLFFQYKLTFATPMKDSLFYLRLMGLDNPLKNFLIQATFANIYLAMLVICCLGGYGISNLTNKRKEAVIALTGAVLTIALLWVNSKYWLNLSQLFRALPVVAAVSVIYAGFRLKFFKKNRDKDILPRLLLIFVFSLFSLLLLAKIILNTHIYHYGFALAMPAFLLFVAAFVYYAPALSARLFGKAAGPRAIGLIFICVLFIAHITFSEKVYNLKTLSVGAGRDRIVTYHPQVSPVGHAIMLTLVKIEELIAKKETFTVFPEGIILNYLSRRRSPCRYYNCMPPEIKVFGEEGVLSSLTKNPPDYIILVERDTSEYGYRYFGHSYGKKIFDWLKANYVKACQIGNRPFSGEGFGISIAKRISKK